MSAKPKTVYAPIGMDDLPRRTEALAQLMEKIRPLAVEYRELTGKPLGVTGEFAETEAQRVMGLTLMPPRHPGFDATALDGKRIQIKGRVLNAKRSGIERMGTIDTNEDKPWDSVMLVILDRNYRVERIHEASRADVLAEMAREDTDTVKARTKAKAAGQVYVVAEHGPHRMQGHLQVDDFERIGKLVWPVT
jgi:hypothetical protein